MNNKKCNKYKHIVFDLDGTLIDSEDLFISTLKESLIHFGLPIDDNISKAFGMSGDDIGKMLKIPKEIGKDFSLYWYLKMCKSTEFKDTYRALSALKDAGYTIGIVSSRDSFLVKDALTRESFAPFVDIIYESEKTGKHKPDPAPLLAYLDDYQLEKYELLYIGDLITDKQCADGAGVDFAYAGWGWKNKHINETLTFYTFDEMLEYFI